LLRKGAALGDWGSFAESCHGILEHEAARAVEVGIGKMFLASVEKISAMHKECNAKNGPSSEKPPPVPPHEGAELAPRRFNGILLEQSRSLRCSERSVDGLERDFRSFKAAVHSESTLSDSLKTMAQRLGLKTRDGPSAPDLPSYVSSVAALPRSSLAPRRWCPTVAH
jgi:hypothetical protein